MLLIGQLPLKRLLREQLERGIQTSHYGLYGHDFPIRMQNLVMKANMMIVGAREPQNLIKRIKKMPKKKNKRQKKEMNIIMILRKNMDYPVKILYMHQ